MKNIQSESMTDKLNRLDAERDKLRIEIANTERAEAARRAPLYEMSERARAYVRKIDACAKTIAFYAPYLAEFELLMEGRVCSEEQVTRNSIHQTAAESPHLFFSDRIIAAAEFTKKKNEEGLSQVVDQMKAYAAKSDLSGLFSELMTEVNAPQVINATVAPSAMDNTPVRVTDFAVTIK